MQYCAVSCSPSSVLFPKETVKANCLLTKAETAASQGVLFYFVFLRQRARTAGSALNSVDKRLYFINLCVFPPCLVLAASLCAL